MPLLARFGQRRIGRSGNQFLQGDVLRGRNVWLLSTSPPTWCEIAGVAVLFEIASERGCGDLEGTHRIAA